MLASRPERHPTKGTRSQMATTLIQEERIQLLNDLDIQNGSYVLYWMQHAQRAEYNHALEFAIQQANDHGLPLLVAFGLTDGYPDANLRHYTFMVEGLQETQRALADRGIKMVVRLGAPDAVALDLGRDAALIVCDRDYVRIARGWRENVAAEAACRVVQVETDVVVPVETVSNKAEYMARTIRPKIHTHLDRFLLAFRTTPLDCHSLELSVAGVEIDDGRALLDSLALDRSVEPVSHLFTGGLSAAKRILRDFLRNRFVHYAENRNQPQTNDVSHMSKYLHFGQISPLYLALQIRGAAGNGAKAQVDAYLEELIVRRELAINFVYFTPDYDAYSCLPNWAQKTLAEHRDDERPHRYTRTEMEQADTHDSYWNAAMREMKHTGYMHNYMRMYWGKKILEWCNTPEYAFQTALALNNKYFIDGRDPNSFAGVAWVFGMHDRAWAEREIFGKVRYMSAAGLERKSDIKAYVKKVDRLVSQVQKVESETD